MCYFLGVGVCGFRRSGGSRGIDCELRDRPVHLKKEGLSKGHASEITNRTSTYMSTCCEIRRVVAQLAHRMMSIYTGHGNSGSRCLLCSATFSQDVGVIISVTLFLV